MQDKTDSPMGRAARWAVVCASIALIALSARVAVPPPRALGGPPISLQSLAVLVLAGALPRPDGVLAAAGYVVLGASGAPIFAGASGGLEVVLGKSGGYLVGFIAGAAIVALGRSPTLLRAFASQLLGTATVLGLGAAHLMRWLTAGDAWRVGVAPYLPGALVKCLVGALLVRGVARARERSRRRALDALRG